MILCQQWKAFKTKTEHTREEEAADKKERSGTNRELAEPDLTRHTDLELATLAEPPLDDTSLPCRQCHLQAHEELKVCLLLEQVSANHSVVVGHLGRETES